MSRVSFGGASGAWAVALALALLAGCQDQVETFISIRHGVATVEVRLQNLWRDGFDCAGAAACAAALDAERQKEVTELTSKGASVTGSGFALRGDELDLVFCYRLPIDKLDDDQIVPIVVQRPGDVRSGRPGVPSIAVLHLAGSPTTVEMKGPAVRMTGDLAKVTGASAIEGLVGQKAPGVVIDVLSRGRGTAHVTIPSTDSDGKVQHGDPWVQAEQGLKELLAERGMLIGG